MKALYLIFLCSTYFLFAGFSSNPSAESDFQTIKQVSQYNTLTGAQIDIHYVSNEDYLSVNHSFAMTYDEYGGCVFRSGNCGRTASGFIVIKPISEYNQP